MKTFPANFRAEALRKGLIHSDMRSSKSLPQMEGDSQHESKHHMLPRSTTIDERHHQRLSSMLMKQAYQQTRLLNCQFNVIVLQTISFIVFWYPLFGLIIADKDFTVDTEIYKALTVLAWMNAPLTPVFFTYFNYECYSSQSPVRLSVVGSATANVVSQQATIVDNLGRSDDEDEEEGGANKPTASSRVAESPQRRSSGKTNQPPVVRQVTESPVSTFKLPPSAMKRDQLQSPIAALKTETLPRIPHQQQQQQGSRDHVDFETIPPWQRPPGSSKSLRDVSTGRQGPSVHFSAQPVQNKSALKRRAPQSDFNVNRPHSYENISGVTFSNEVTRRSRTYQNYEDSSDDEEEALNSNITSWTGVVKKQQHRPQQSQQMISWTKIAKQQSHGDSSTIPTPPRMGTKTLPNNVRRSGSTRSASSRFQQNYDTSSDTGLFSNFPFELFLITGLLFNYRRCP